MNTHWDNVEVAEWMMNHHSVKAENHVMPHISHKAARIGNNLGEHVGYQHVKVQAHALNSHPRVTQVAERMRMVPGFALDFTTAYEAGKQWDVNDPTQRQRAPQVVRAQPSVLLIVCPMCDAFSTPNSVKYKMLREPRIQDIIVYGIQHFEIARYICNIHARHGLHYMFEHPRYTRSWQESGVVVLMRTTA